MSVIQTAQNPEEVRKRKIVYQESDGKPMGETEWHVNLILYFVAALRNHFANLTEIYICGNNFIFWEEGNPKKFISPDTYVVFGVPRRVRSSYRAWNEGGRLPNVVFEFTSRKTRREDMGKKFALYEQVLKVPEYFLFDPLGDYLKPALQGYRLVNGQYAPIPLRNDRLFSDQLKLELVLENGALRLFDPSREEWLLSAEELAQKIREEKDRADTETLRADEEAFRAEQAWHQAREEAQRAEIAEAELARVRAELKALREQMEREGR